MKKIEIRKDLQVDKKCTKVIITCSHEWWMIGVEVLTWIRSEYLYKKIKNKKL